MSKAAIRTLELQCLEAMRQYAEPGTTAAAKQSCVETAVAAMRGVAALQPKPRKARRSAGGAPRRKRLVLHV
jgi:hypothetical protein